MVITTTLETAEIPPITAPSINSSPVVVKVMAANGGGGSVGSNYSSHIPAKATITASPGEGELATGIVVSMDHNNLIMHNKVGMGVGVGVGVGLDKAHTMPDLSTLSLDELKQLDTDPEFFDDFIEEMLVVQQLNEELDSMINQVEVIARENESKEVHLVELKRKLSDDVTTLKNLGEKCDELNKKYVRKSEEYEPQHIKELLQIAASDADTDCEKHVELFLNGKIDVQTFLQSYTHSKKMSSERKVKEERLAQQLEALERAGL